MQRKRIDLPLHSGRCPFWLFEKMRKLAGLISQIIIEEKGPDFFLERLSSPFWFQAFGCVLGFDWHSSGLTTTVCGALKEAFKDLKGLGIYVCGGKGLTSRKTPQEIKAIAEKKGFNPEKLIFASKFTAKVDNNCVQDGFQLYHHSFIFSKEGRWIVIQQGMKDSWARRYHWDSQSLTSFIKEPHRGIVSDKFFLTLNLVDKEKDSLRNSMKELSQRAPHKNLKDIIKIKENQTQLPLRHRILIEDINPKRLEETFLITYEKRPHNFQALLGLEGVGLKTLRALALISDLIYGEPLSFKDPARFSFAHGGKDGYPYKISLPHYQKTIEVLERAIKKAKVERQDKFKALKRLHSFYKFS
ncbi:MAG: DUF763 domain-containing protein [Candidatus Omnitrophica bacterium]|nr:DUF763 domain-containing protein [Candidatus Omnitrophota bacterium]